MQHVDPDRLAFLALGEPPADADGVIVAAHLRECGACRDEVAVLRHVVELARDTVRHADDAQPPESVWHRIADQALAGAAPLPAAYPPPPRPTRLDRRRAERRRWPRAVAGLVAAAAVGVLGTLGGLRVWPSAADDPVVASRAVLAPVAGGPADAAGAVSLVRTASGRELRVTASRLPLQQGYYEVWVYDGRREMVALGVLGPGSSAVLPLPPTLDPRTYHTVDISSEQYDGDQTHSGRSVLRGTLTG